MVRGKLFIPFHIRLGRWMIQIIPLRKIRSLKEQHVLMNSQGHLVTISLIPKVGTMSSTEVLVLIRS